MGIICKIIGHKHATYEEYSQDGKWRPRAVIHYSCVRCGKTDHAKANAEAKEAWKYIDFRFEDEDGRGAVVHTEIQHNH
jgi:AAA+ superfamily predicted ATPase